VFLKIAKSGQAIFLYYSRDGQKWNPVRSFSLGQSGDLQVGFSSQSPSGTGVSATFSEIQYKPQRVANLFAGN
jgi:regulation of enolase protein 1 (concanavalin A-like superfamily)